MSDDISDSSEHNPVTYRRSILTVSKNLFDKVRQLRTHTSTETKWCQIKTGRGRWRQMKKIMISLSLEKPGLSMPHYLQEKSLNSNEKGYLSKYNARSIQFNEIRQSEILTIRIK